MYDGTVNTIGEADVSVLKQYAEAMSDVIVGLKQFSGFRSSAEAVLKTMQELTPGFADTAKAVGEVAKATGEAAEAGGKQNVVAELGAKAMEVLSKNTVLHSAATKVATVIQTAWNAVINSSALVIMLLVAAVAAVVVALGVLINHIKSTSDAYKAQKAEVDALSAAQEELAQSSQESADAFESSSDRLEATGTVAEGLIGAMKGVAKFEDDVATKHEKMAALCANLNAAMSGLNIAYDKESGTIRNLNSGQEISLAQLGKLVEAKSKLAEADAWAERQNELLSEQVKIEEELALNEQKRKEIQADTSLGAGEQAKLLDELATSQEELTVQLEDNGSRLAVVNENIAASSLDTSEQLVTNYETINSAITANGESLDEVAAKWGVSSELIGEAMGTQNITLDEWVANQEAAWQSMQDSVEEKTSNVVNSFGRLSDEFEMSGEEMLGNLQHNKEQYAAWETNMAEITRLLGPTAAEEFSKLGPEANSAISEILASEDMLQEYADVFGVQIGNATDSAVEDWHDPNFIGAPADALSAAAGQIVANTAMSDATSGNIDAAKKACLVSAQSTVTEVQKALQPMATNGSDIAKRMMDGILTGMNNGLTSVQRKANEIANVVSAAMRKALAVHSPSRVMIGIFKNVMLGVIDGMDSMKDKAYSTSAGIANGIAEKLALSPEQAGMTNAKLLALSGASLSSVASAPAAYAGGFGLAGEAGSAGLLRRAVDILDEYLPEVANMQVVLDTGAAVGGMAPAMDIALGRRARKKERG